MKRRQCVACIRTIVSAVAAPLLGALWLLPGKDPLRHTCSETQRGSSDVILGRLFVFDRQGRLSRGSQEARTRKLAIHGTLSTTSDTAAPASVLEHLKVWFLSRASDSAALRGS
ncbi:hypothetical protein BJX68DRAFT_55570 [Aspergillus pseudodeflectus]|uniref:Secreted protein n=1 Tax=Aspergillus pseudodeflectus TaxID=176178 RepID=A0ABR4KK16_9EURO